MPRDSSGNFTLPAGNPVISDTSIASTWANTTMEDLAVGLSDSLDRYGRGGMLAPFRFADGNVNAPGSSWANEPTSGMYRAANGDVRMGILAQDIMRWTGSGAQLWNAVRSIWEDIDTADVGTVNLASYCVGDGVTDVSAEFNAASLAAQGGTLLIPEGIYVGENLVFYSNTRYIGLGRSANLISSTTGVQFKLLDGSSNDLVVTDGYINDNAQLDFGIYISDILFYGNKGSGATGDILHLSTNAATVERCGIIDGGGHGIVLDPENSAGVQYTSGTNGNRFNHLVIRNNEGHGFLSLEGASGLGGPDNIISNCRIGLNGGGATANRNIYIERGAGWHIYANIIWGAPYGDVYVDGLSGGGLCNNQIESKDILTTSGNTFNTLEVSVGPWATTITGNQLTQNDAAATAGVTYNLLDINVPPSQQTSAAVSVTGNGFNGTNFAPTAIVVQGAPTSQHLKTQANTYNNVTVSHSYEYDKPDTQEGVFTPTVDFATTGDFLPSYITQEGRYTRVGNTVHFDLQVRFDANAYTTASGSFQINGLPFTSVNDNGVFYRGVSLGYMDNVTYDSGELQMCPFVPSNSSQVQIRITRSGLASRGLDTDNIPASRSNVRIYISGTYEVA